MIMNVRESKTGRRIQTAVTALAAAGLMALASCGVTEPDESPWRDVQAFSWDTTEGTRMYYKVETMHSPTDTADVVTLPGTVDYHGRPMRMLHKTYRSTGTSQPAPLRFHFLPLPDTLVTHNEEFKATYALVAPLEKNRTWVAGYADGRPDSATVKATIVERYTYWKLEGKVYRNVVAVKYERIGPHDPREPLVEWIRFYAEGIGEVLTVKNQYPISNFPTQAQPQAVQRVTLLETSAE